MNIFPSSYFVQGHLTLASPAGRFGSERCFHQSESWQIAALSLGRSPVCVQAGLGFAILFHSDDYMSLLVPFFDIAVRFSDLF